MANAAQVFKDLPAGLLASNFVPYFLILSTGHDHLVIILCTFYVDITQAYRASQSEWVCKLQGIRVKGPMPSVLHLVTVKYTVT